MASVDGDQRAVARPAIGVGWPTGAKVFLILSAALLPLALIAVFATLKTTQIANSEARSRLRVASAEASRGLAIELIGDMTALRVAVDALGNDPADAPSCARVQGVFAQQRSIGTRFVIRDRAGRPLCGTAFREAGAITHDDADPAVDAKIIPGRGLLLGIEGRSRRVTAAALFPTQFLALLSRPGGFSPPYSATLVHDGDALVLQTLQSESALERRETNRTALGIADLTLEMQVRSTPISSPLVVALLLPLVMWAMAAGIAWFVVDRLLIRPLRALRSNVAAFTPGEEMDPRAMGPMPAQEIRDLSETFRAISRTVALHEAGLAEGLVRQTKLTREVHHRVKNNLQVIASLINFHSRGAIGQEASRAYASIQRRVDALAVVHRNHFAEMEENRGLGLRGVLGELASNIRATAPEGTRLGIVLDADPFLVNQDVGVAVAFLVTEMIELAVSADPGAQLRISLKPAAEEGRATLRVSSRALIESDSLREGIEHRYGRVMEGLSRQLRSPLHHDPLTGAYEITIAVTGCD